jgi:hypothetical protein
MKITTTLRVTVLAGVMACGIALVSNAQNASTMGAHTSVALIHVKPDMLNEWIDLEKNEVIPAQKKGGLKTRTTFQTMRGNVFEYIIATPFEKYGEFDGQSPQVKALGAEGAARLTAKLRRCEDSVQVYVSTPMRELSNLPGGDLPPMAVYSRYRVANGKMQEYQNFIKSDILPLYKKAEVSYQVNQRGLGANNNDMVSISYVKNYAELDLGPAPTRILGADGAAKLNMKRGTMATLVEQVIRRRVPDLSF